MERSRSFTKADLGLLFLGAASMGLTMAITLKRQLDDGDVVRRN
jgi:hypothetical protein